MIFIPLKEIQRDTLLWSYDMEYSKLLDIASDLGYGLAMSGAETFRVEESLPGFGCLRH